MNLYDSKTYQRDLLKVALHVLNVEFFRNKAVLVTGATGLICSAVVDLLLTLDDEFRLGLKVYAATRNREKCAERFLEKLDENRLVHIPYDATREFTIGFDVDCIIHGASNAAPRLLGAEPVETFFANVFGTVQLLKLCVNKKCRFRFISSSEVYGILPNQLVPISESQSGFIDNLNPRNAYAEAKRAAENLCSAYKAEYGIDFVIARPGHIYGPTALQSDNRVSSQFMYEAVRGKDLVLKSAGTQIRSYCYCLDCASALLSILTCGKNGEAYNISNKESVIMIREMAKIFAKYANVNLVFDIPSCTEKENFNPMSNSSLCSKKLENLGWSSAFRKEEGFHHSIETIRELRGI